MTDVVRKDTTGVASGTSLRIEMPETQGARQAIVATAWGGGPQVKISLTCSGTNRVLHADGLSGASVTQIFAIDLGFSGWVEARVEGPGAIYDLALTATAL